MKKSFSKRNILLFLRQYIGGNSLLESYENRFLKYSNDAPPPAFIIGAPRTGSTLLYQLLISNFRFSYFSNLASFFYKSPAWITRKSRSFFKRYTSTEYQSKFGVVSGIWSPSEAGQIYRYWFEENEHHQTMRERISRTVNSISKTMAGPFIWKCLDVSMIIDKIVKIFPNAIFIYIKRNPVYVSQSLLLTRKNKLGNFNEWLGFKPPGYEEILHLSNLEQVIWQVKSTDEHIQKTLSASNIKDVIPIQYEELCRHPKKAIGSVIDNYRSKKIDIEKLNEDIPEFKISEKKILPQQDWDLLLKNFDRYITEKVKKNNSMK